MSYSEPFEDLLDRLPQDGPVVLSVEQQKQLVGAFYRLRTELTRAQQERDEAVFTARECVAFMHAHEWCPSGQERRCPWCGGAYPDHARGCWYGGFLARHPTERTVSE